MKRADNVFEISYEICNKIGGIYTVIKSKSFYMSENYGDGYYTIGLYNPKRARVEFEERQLPDNLKNVIKTLSKDGIKCHYGRWLIPGRPRTILLDTSGFKNKLNEIKAELWKTHKADSLQSDELYDDCIVWSTAVGMLLEKLMGVAPFKGSKCVAHFHEWLSGAALLYLKNKNVKIGTVFTTHATMLGRSLAGAKVDLYKMIRTGHDGDSNLMLAERYGVTAKHTMEVACAKNADAFTTVSQVTAREARYILGREPDIILPNGLDTGKFLGIEELMIMRRKNRVQTRDFLTAYFSRYYKMDFYNIRSIFISGRYEFHNKGIDLFIDALGKLNEKLKKNRVDKNAVIFIWIPAETRDENIEILKNKSLYEELHDHVAEAMPEIEDTIIHSLTMGEMPKKILSEEFLRTCKELIVHFTEKKGENPPLCAFELAEPEEQNQILNALKKNKLMNKKSDKVKVIYYPAYLSPADRLIALDYNSATITCDVGVFPSYYEPWGYTPLETAAQGSLAITTDLAGFGKFVEGRGPGIYVLKREGNKWSEIVSVLADKLYEIVTMPKMELARRRMNAKELSALADWKELTSNYIVAHNLAIDKVRKR